MSSNAEITDAGILPPVPLRPLVGALMALKTDTVVPSELSFRPPLSPTDPSDLELRESIKQTGGNATAGEAMRYADPDRPGMALYQVIAGHRALEVCRELGFDFNAVVVDALPDLELAMRMAHSNSGRKPVPGVAAGRFYQECMDRSLFKSQADMARRFGVSMAMVSTSCSLARLPSVVISAFPDEDAIQHRYDKPLKDALRIDEKAVLAMAKRLTKEQAKLAKKKSAAEVMVELTKTTKKGVQDAEPNASSASHDATGLVDSDAEVVVGAGQASNPAGSEIEEKSNSFGGPLLEMPPIAADEADEIPTSSSRSLRRDGDVLRASAIVRPSKGWSILVDRSVDVGVVVRTAADEVQATVGLGPIFTDDDCRDFADHIAEFVKERAFKPEPGTEA